MKLYVVTDENGVVQSLCQKRENAELRIPLLKRDKKTQQVDRTWKYGYGAAAWHITHVEVGGEKAPGTSTDIVFVIDAENINFGPCDGDKFRILDTDGLMVEELV